MKKYLDNLLPKFAVLNDYMFFLRILSSLKKLYNALPLICAFQFIQLYLFLFSNYFSIYLFAIYFQLYLFLFSSFFSIYLFVIYYHFSISLSNFPMLYCRLLQLPSNIQTLSFSRRNPSVNWPACS